MRWYQRTSTVSTIMSRSGLVAARVLVLGQISSVWASMAAPLPSFARRLANRTACGMDTGSVPSTRTLYMTPAPRTAAVTFIRIILRLDEVGAFKRKAVCGYLAAEDVPILRATSATAGAFLQLQSRRSIHESSDRFRIQGFRHVHVKVI
ncbi:hypothetical protein [Arthrobacter sp. 92]|uniref:hypothetical protein n=1 Tax=Arthrobacter sp. 92 TaxID=3418175 RepID=UPI003CFF9A02